MSLENLADYDVVLFVDVPDVAPETVASLERFVERGGGFLVFLGAQVDAQLYNRRLGAALLPGKLLETVSATTGRPR